MICLVKFIIGAGFIIGGIILEISWLALCFGTVIVGIALLIFAPHVLFIPFSVGTTIGMGLIASCKD